MQYDFNRPIDRWDNYAVKYDEMEQKYGRRDLLPMWIADMDLPTAQPVLDAMARIAEGMCSLAHGYGKAGVDAVYYASLGAEHRWFTAEEFEKWIAPFDKLILSEIQKAGCKAFLHICKDGLEMDRYKGYNDVCDVVNWGIYEAPYSVEDARKLFPGKTIMGGLANRSGVMVEGAVEDLAQAAKDAVARYGQTGFILGADCTLPTEIDTGRIRAIAEALRESR